MKLIGIKKTKFIIDNFFEQSFKGEQPQKELFDSLNSPTELHYLASIYNWDDGTEVLNWIIDHPKCDKATALMIFWKAEPDFYTRFENEIEAGYEADVFRLVRKIISNYEGGFYRKAKLYYDPIEDGRDINYLDSKAKWMIPENLKYAIKRNSVYSIDEIFKGFKSWWKITQRQLMGKNRNKKRRNYR